MFKATRPAQLDRTEAETALSAGSVTVHRITLSERAQHEHVSLHVSYAYVADSRNSGTLCSYTAELLSVPKSCSLLFIHNCGLSNPKNMSSLKAQKKTSQALLDAYNAWNIDQILAMRTSDCMQYILPASLGREPRNNEEYRAFFEQQMMPLFKEFAVSLSIVFKRNLLQS